MLLAGAASVLATPALRDVFSRGQADSTGVSYFCFRIPALARTANGSLIAFAEGRHVNCNDQGGGVRLVRRISHDEGATWSAIDQVKSEDGHTIGNPCPIVDRVTGHVHLLFSRDNREAFVTRSTDGGVSWAPSINLSASLNLELDPTNPFFATGPPGGIQLEISGRLIGAFYYNGLNGTRSASIFSDDHGASWRRSADVQVSQTPLPNASSVVYNGGESQVAQDPTAGPNALVMLMRVRGDFPAPTQPLPLSASPPPPLLASRVASPNAVDHNHATAVSSDGGATWSPASLLPIQSPYCEGSIATIARATPAPGGRAFGDWDFGGRDFGGRAFVSTPSTRNGGRANLTLWSATRGASGAISARYVSTVYPRAAAYSSLLAGSERDTLLNLFERDPDPYVPRNLTLAYLTV